MMSNTSMIRRIAAVVLLLLTMSAAYAADRYWIGNGSNTSWNNTANWSTISGGSGGASVPGSADVAIFDGSGTGNCTIDATVNIAGINVQSGYTGTISQGANAITVGASNATFSGGTFTGGSANIVCSGNFTLSGTAFTSTSATLTCEYDYTFSSGSFAHNNGTLRFRRNSTLTGSTTFYNIEFYPAVAATDYNIASGTTFIASNLLRYYGSLAININTGTIECRGDISLESTYTGGGGTGLVRINGTGNQTLTGLYTTANTVGRLPNVEINKSSGTLTLVNFITVAGNWTYIAGTIDATTNNSTIMFIGNKTITGSHSLNNIGLNGGVTSTITIASGDTLTALGDLTYYSVNGIIVNTGILEAKGNINLNNTSTGGGGNATLLINGSGNQTITGYSGTSSALSRLPNVQIHKSSDTLFLQNYMAVAGNWTYTAGIIDYGTSTVIMVNSKTISGTHELYNVAFAGNGSTYTIASGNTLTVNGILQTTGTGNLYIDQGTINAKGDITIQNTGKASGGTATINITGNNIQQFTGNGLAARGSLCNIVIDKAEGSLKLYSIISSAKNWTYISGTVDATSNASTVAFSGISAIDAQGASENMSFYDLTIYSNSSTLQGELNIDRNIFINGGASFNSNSYLVNIGGNWHNSGTYTPGTTTVTFNGPGDIQTIYASIGSETFYSLALNKDAGNLQLDIPVTVTNAITLTKGPLVTTSTNILTLNDNATASGASDASYVSGPMKKVGDDAFTFPLGGASGGINYYHPLSITAPAAATDAFTAEYFAAGYPNDSVMVDSLEYVSDCEYWELERVIGTSNVIPSLGWNVNSCLTDDYNSMRVAGWDGTKWADAGSASIAAGAGYGTITASVNIPFSSNLAVITIAKKKKSNMSYATLKRKLDGGCYIANNGSLYFKYDEEYNDVDNTLTFNIYDKYHNVVVSTGTINPSLLPTLVSDLGDRRYFINLLNCNLTSGGNLAPGGYYILEVVNEKEEKWLLRFQHLSTISSLCAPVNNNNPQ